MVTVNPEMAYSIAPEETSEKVYVPLESSAAKCPSASVVAMIPVECSRETPLTGSPVRPSRTDPLRVNSVGVRAKSTPPTSAWTRTGRLLCEV